MPSVYLRMVSEVHVKHTGERRTRLGIAQVHIFELFEVRPNWSVVLWLTPQMQTDEITLAELD
jgi:hypothetical protein